MRNVLFKLIITQPQLLLCHVENYVDLIIEIVDRTTRQWQRRWLLFALSLGFFALGVVCSLMSLLLFSALPVLNPHSSWVLFGLPISLLLIAAVLYVAAKRCKVEPFLQDLQEQIALDMLALCKAPNP